jgi:hypothetical protein
MTSIPLHPTRDDDLKRISTIVDISFTENMVRHARAYVRRGMALTPIRPRDKRPYLRDWGHRSLRTVKQIEAHWNRRLEDNVGLILGPASGMCDIEHDTDEARDTLNWLLSDRDKLTATYVSGKSTHRLYQLPELPERLAGSNVLAVDGIELRLGLDGQMQSVLPPSIHPSGRSYTWSAGLAPWQMSMKPCPVDVIEYIEERLAVRQADHLSTDRKPRERAMVQLPSGERPGDVFNATATWADVLCPHGWRIVGTKDDLTLWVHPRAESGAHSATTGYITAAGNDVLSVFSTRTPFQTVLNGGHTYTKFEAYTLLNHDGDRTKAAAALAEAGFKIQNEWTIEDFLQGFEDLP